jgi:hypothetical protein
MHNEVGSMGPAKEALLHREMMSGLRAKCLKTKRVSVLGEGN